MSRFSQALGYGALEQVALRALDFLTLWIVLHTLPEADLAAYGVATGMLFLFNVVLIAPESALLRDRMKWAASGELGAQLKAFLLFAELRILFLVVLAACAAWLEGPRGVLFYACVFSLIGQTIQLAEIARIDFRADLRQKTILATELPLKALLLALAALLFLAPGLINYLVIYLAWAVISALVWLRRFRHGQGVGINLEWRLLGRIRAVMGGFAFWQHLSWLVTCVVFNIDPWVLTWFAADTATVATYTLALKVAWMFFMAPVFLQTMTGILLLNSPSEAQRRRIFRGMFQLNAGLSLAQFLIFAMAGEWIGRVFRGDDLNVELFLELGLILNLGGLALNLARPLIADLTLHGDVRRLLVAIHLPVLVVGIAGYLWLTPWLGAPGCALASALAYLVFALLLSVQSATQGVAWPALKSPGLQRS